jgi:TonB family protein
VGLIKLGDLEQKRNQKAEAQAFYQQAAGVLGNQPEAAPAYMHLGTLALVQKDFDGAVANFQQAQVADPAKAGVAMMWMALARERQGNVTDAESLFRGALALQGEGSAEAATTMTLYAQMLQQMNRTDEATAMTGRAAEVRKAARSQLAKPLSASSGAYRVGGGVSAPKLLYKVEPEYSEEARAAKYQGTVVLYVEIGPDGYAHNPAVLQSLGLGLDQKALDAVNQWKFQPGTKDGAPVTVQASIEVNFRLL